MVLGLLGGGGGEAVPSATASTDPVDANIDGQTQAHSAALEVMQNGSMPGDTSTARAMTESWFNALSGGATDGPTVPE